MRLAVMGNTTATAIIRPVDTERRKIASDIPF